MPFADAAQIINDFLNLFFETELNPNLDVITLVIFVICIGWIIFALGNKEA